MLPLKRGNEVGPLAKIPDAPDISPAPRDTEAAPDEEVTGLTELKPTERSVVGQHFVIWGSLAFSDIRERPVKRHAVSEDEYAAKMRRETEWLVANGLKDPDPEKLYGKSDVLRHRADRAEQYARWRYRGFVCGEVASL